MGVSTLLYVGQKARIDCVEKYQGNPSPAPLPIDYETDDPVSNPHVTLTPSGDVDHTSCTVEAIAPGGSLVVKIKAGGTQFDTQVFSTVMGVDEIATTVIILP